MSIEKIDILDIATEAMKRRIDVLNILKTYEDKGLGIEGWFKCELLYEFDKRGIPVMVQNKGPDLNFGHMEIELKGAVGKVSKWIAREGLKYGIPVLYLGRTESIKDLNPEYRVINEDWVVGLIEPPK